VAVVNAARRQLAEAASFPPLLAFLPPGDSEYAGAKSWLRRALPANVKLLTLTTNYQGFDPRGSPGASQLLLRLPGARPAGERVPRRALPPAPAAGLRARSWAGEQAGRGFLSGRCVHRRCLGPRR
jgi:hypothetical protein